jgi:putative colanic acid biosynthesis UDP-glucose lipid carrier transferase
MDKVGSYLVRHWVKPGITGWAQVNGFRGETKTLQEMQKRVEFDIWYIENYTFWLDIKIILMTMYNALKGEQNAY